MEKKIRILVITHAPWRNDTSVGNSYSNILCGMDDRFEFAQLYIRDGMPENNMVHKYFYISERKLLKSVFSRRSVGEYFYLEDPMNTPKVTFSNSYNKMRKLRWDIFLLARDIASSLGVWKSIELDKFLEDFKPDIIFGTFAFVTTINQLMVYCHDKTGAKMVLYPWDDWYHINQYNKSITYRLRIQLERYYMRKCASRCNYMYTITEKMANEYSAIFKKKCKVLRKGYDFKDKPITKNVNPKEIKFMYAGNIGDKRWTVLAEIAKAILLVNKNYNIKMHMYIYTLSPVDDEINMALNVKDACSLMGGISSQEVPGVLEQADVLIHVESFDKVKLETSRASFSTKLVDYFKQGKCILAVGGQNASMQYLIENDAALVVDNISKLYLAIKKLASNPEIIAEYGDKAWQCGKLNHNINRIQEMIFNDFKELINNEGCTN